MAGKSPIEVGPARLGELAALVALEQRCFRGDRMSARQYRHHLTSTRARVLAARRGGVLVGSAVALFRAGSTHARLYSIAVDPAARGLGVGDLLRSAVEADAAERGLDEVRLEVRQDNAAAIRLYESAGYQRFRAREDYYEDGAPAWCYRRQLSIRP